MPLPDVTVPQPITVAKAVLGAGEEVVLTRLLLRVVVMVMTVITELVAVVDVATGAESVIVVLEITTMLKLDVEVPDWALALVTLSRDCLGEKGEAEADRDPDLLVRDRVEEEEVEADRDPE